jgi:hypothetical protein
MDNKKEACKDNKKIKKLKRQNACSCSYNSTDIKPPCKNLQKMEEFCCVIQ